MRVYKLNEKKKSIIKRPTQCREVKNQRNRSLQCNSSFRTEKYFMNLVDLNQNKIVITHFFY